MGTHVPFIFSTFYVPERCPAVMCDVTPCDRRSEPTLLSYEILPSLLYNAVGLPIGLLLVASACRNLPILKKLSTGSLNTTSIIRTRNIKCR